jgi:hypothetical protein
MSLIDARDRGCVYDITDLVLRPLGLGASAMLNLEAPRAD